MAEPFSAESRLIHAGTDRTLSGHSDVILGAVVSRDRELLAAVRAWRSSGGGVPGPFEAWLALRGGVEPAADLISDIDQALEVL